MILASSGAGIVPIPTMCEMDLLEKDTKPQGESCSEFRDTPLFCLYVVVLYNPCASLKEGASPASENWQFK